MPKTVTVVDLLPASANLAFPKIISGPPGSSSDWNLLLSKYSWTSYGRSPVAWLIDWSPPAQWGCYCFRSVRLCVCLSVCLSVRLSVNTITAEPLEISSRNFQGIILWAKGWTGSKMAIWVCTGCGLTSALPKKYHGRTMAFWVMVQSWLSMVKQYGWPRLTTTVNHGLPYGWTIPKTHTWLNHVFGYGSTIWSTMVNHGQPWSTILFDYS